MDTPPPARARRRLRRSRVWVIALACLALVSFLVVNAPSVAVLAYRWRFDRRVAALPAAPGFAPDDRVLVVAPHPDDESLCCAGMIQQARSAGAEVTIVWLTSGDGFELDAVVTEHALRPGPAGLEDLARRRMGEARAAAAGLGVPEDHLVFLGYPDGGLERLFLDAYDRPYTSPTTGLSAVRYPGALSPGAAFTGGNLQRDLETVFDRSDPTVVLAPALEDEHPDHRTAGSLTLRILGARGRVDAARWWIVHGGLEWPLPKGLHAGLPLTPAPRGRQLRWLRSDLTSDQEAVKLQALRTHASQMEVLGRFMEAFVRRNELVSPDPVPPVGGAR